MQTHKKGRIARVAGMAVALFFVSFSVATAQETFLKDKWGVGLRAGAGMLTHEILLDADGSLGPVVSGSIMYGLEEILLLGINVEWEAHRVKLRGVDWGNATTISVIPFVEFRYTEMKPLAPYVSFGMGVNFNSFDVNSTVFKGQFASFVFNNLDPPTTVAVKAAVGADYFFARNLALNAEVGWKYNSGKADFSATATPNPPDPPVPSTVFGRDDWNISAASILIGLRYFF